MSFSKEFRTYIKTLASVSGAEYEEHGMDLLVLEYTHADNPEAPTIVYMKINTNKIYTLRGFGNYTFDTEKDMQNMLRTLVSQGDNITPPDETKFKSFLDNPTPFIAMAQPRFSREFKHNLRLHVANVQDARLKSFGDQRILLELKGDIYELKCTGESKYTWSINGNDTEPINNDQELMQRAQTLFPIELENGEDQSLSDTIRTFANDLCRITNGHLSQPDETTIKLELKSDKGFIISYQSESEDPIKVVFIGGKIKEYRSEEAAEQSIKKYIVFNYPDYLDAVVKYCNDPETYPAPPLNVEPLNPLDDEYRAPYYTKNEEDPLATDYTRYTAPPPPGPDLVNFQIDLHDLVNRVFDAILARIQSGAVANETIDIQKRAMRTVVESLKTGYIGFTDTLTELLQTLNRIVDSM